MKYPRPKLTCKRCNKSDFNVAAEMIIKVNTTIISSVYLNKWTDLCKACKAVIAHQIERQLNGLDWPKANDSTASPSETAAE